MAIKRKQLLEIADKAAEMGLVIPPSIMLDLGRKDAEEIIAALIPGPTPIFTLNEPGLVPPPGGKKLVLGSEGWIKAPLGNRYIMGGGSAGGAGGSGDVIDSGVVVGRLTKGVTDSKHITAAAIIPPATNILTINNAAPSTLALNINNGKILTLASDGTHSVNFWADVVFYYDGVNKYSLEFDVQTKLVLRENTTTLFTGGGTIALGGYTLTVPATGTAVLLPAAPAAYTLTNVTTDRAYDANSTSLDEIADTLGTLIADLKALGLVG